VLEGLFQATYGWHMQASPLPVKSRWTKLQPFKQQGSPVTGSESATRGEEGPQHLSAFLALLRHVGHQENCAGVWQVCLSAWCQ